MKKLLFVPLLLIALVSCETETTNTDTERFYRDPWKVELNRSHGALGTLPAASEDMSGNAVLTKNGGLNYDMSLLNHHMHQYWSYSWSTDNFFMNWEPCIEWYINEEADSMYLRYNYQDYDPNTQNSFYWDYKVHFTR